MQLIVILLATVSVLTLLSGIVVLCGSFKRYRARSIWFFLAALCATIWMTAISFFLVADSSFADVIDWHVVWTFISAIMLDVAFLGFSAWDTKIGKFLVLGFFVLGLALSSAIALFPGEFYSDVTLAPTGNTITINVGLLYFAYNGFFAAIIPAIVISYLKQYFHSRSARRRGGDLVTAVGYGLSSLVIFICNLILPLLGNWNMIWLGPLSLAVTIISVYYTVLRYRAIRFSSIWLKIFSDIIILASVAIVYMIIFALIFAALFRGSTPSIEVIILNFIMILIFLTLMPAINTLMNSVRVLINGTKESEKEEHEK